VSQFAVGATTATAEQSAADLSDYINFTISNLDAVSSAISGFAALAGENTKLGKALAITQIIIDTYHGRHKGVGSIPTTIRSDCCRRRLVLQVLQVLQKVKVYTGSYEW
jgi:hypothetical protein